MAIRFCLEFKYKCYTKKLAKLFAFLDMWVEWCKEFDRNIKDKINGRF